MLRTRFLNWLFAFALLLGVGCSSVVSQSEPSLRIGASEVDITPPIGHRMAGYFDERLATGVRDPLLAKAFVIQQGPEKLALVFCDVLFVSLNVSSKARVEVNRETGIPVRNIVICATHSHTGPLFEDVRRDYFHEKAVAKLGYDPMEQVHYPELLRDRIVQAVKQANAKLAPATLIAGSGELEGFSFNRRYHMTNGTVQFNPGIRNPAIVRPAGPIDPQVSILIARRQGDNAPFAGVTLFACHCDTTGGTRYSGDYPFHLSEALRRSFGGGFISAFGAGTCGDINHIDVAPPFPVDGVLIPERLGTNLARTVVQALPGLRAVSHPSLAARSRTLSVPLQEVAPEQVAVARERMSWLQSGQGTFMEKVEVVKALDLSRRGHAWPTEVQVFRIDNDTAIVCLPGEVFVELGLAIKRQSPFSNTLVISLCNDAPGYVPTLKAFAEGSYEVTNSRLKAGSGESLVATALEMLKELKPRK